MTDEEAETDVALGKLLDRAERKIQAVMLELEEDVSGSGYLIDHVNVDTRNFANMKTEILLFKKST